MYDARNPPQKTPLSHYIRTGQKIDGFRPDSYKSSKGITPAQVRLGIEKSISEPDRSLFRHYLGRSGQRFDMVSEGLLRYITGARVFRESRNEFLGQIQRDLLAEADKLCGQSQEDYILGREKPIKRFRKKFSNNRSIDFTSAFFSLGNSYIGMGANAYVEVNCITGGVSITGNINYEINDWYRDVFDFEDKIPGYQEFFGIAFEMVAHWSEAFDLSGRFR